MLKDTPALANARRCDLGEPIVADILDSVAPVIVPSRCELPVTVVDCGSGSTRAIFLKEDGGSSKILREKSDWRGAPLAVALQDEARSCELAHLLADGIPEGPVLMGATAGVRHALNTGLVHEPQLCIFVSCLRERFGDRVELAVLSGEEEARAEWEALEHLLGEKWARSGSVEKPPVHVSGMFSGGGMSCQLAVRGEDGSSEPRVLSFENFVLTPGGIVEKAASGRLMGADLPEALAWYVASTKKALCGLPRHKEGVFALIEWVALYVANEPTERDLAMGMGYERMLSYSEVVEALDGHLETLLEGTSSSEPVPRSTAVALAYGTVIRTTLEQVFDDGIYFYAVAGVNWATGHYLLSRRMACTVRMHAV